MFTPVNSTYQYNGTITVKMGQKWKLGYILEKIADQFFWPLEIKCDFFTIIGSKTQADDICYPSRATSLLRKFIWNESDLEGEFLLFVIAKTF